MGAENRYDTSSDYFILMDEATQPILTPNLAQLRPPAFQRLIPVLRGTLAQRAVGSMAVEVVDVHAEHTEQMAPTEDGQPVPSRTGPHFVAFCTHVTAKDPVEKIRVFPPQQAQAGRHDRGGDGRLL